jgi:hypothetical protein
MDNNMMPNRIEEVIFAGSRYPVAIEAIGLTRLLIHCHVLYNS